eukprot:Skav212985  [mRNA]  locus=scaffold423:155322:156519:- [translate_table: standard]
MLRSNRTLKVLDLVNCGLMDAGAEALMDGIEQSGVEAVCANLSPSVKRLCLASCGMAVGGAAAVAKMLQSDSVATGSEECGRLMSK